MRGEFRKSIKPEELEGDLGLVAQLCGLEVALTLYEEFGGTQVSIPKSGLKRAAARFIRENYNGSNAKQLSLATGYSLRFVFEASSGKQTSKGE